MLTLKYKFCNYLFEKLQKQRERSDFHITKNSTKKLRSLISLADWREKYLELRKSSIFRSLPWSLSSEGSLDCPLRKPSLPTPLANPKWWYAELSCLHEKTIHFIIMTTGVIPLLWPVFLLFTLRFVFI